MPKHIVKKIWILIIVIYIAISAGSVFYVNHHLPKFVECFNSYQPTVLEETYTLEPISSSRISHAGPIPANSSNISDGNCNSWSNSHMGLITGVVIFLGSFILGIVINAIMELFHFIYLGLRERTHHTIKYGLFINLILSLVIFTIFSFFMLNQMGLL